MSALSIQVPFPVFQDRDGQPLDNGYVWIGVPNLPPQTNPVNVYFDEALTILAPQPLRTINGYISNAGTPAQVCIDGVNFSILVQDSKGSMVYNFPEGAGISPNASGVVYDPAGTGALQTTVQAKLRETVSVKDFGAVGDGATDDTSEIQAAVTHCFTTGDQLYWPDGVYPTTASIANFHSVRHVGIGVIKRETTVFAIQPERSATNRFYVSPTGSPANDGLSAAQPMQGVQSAFDAIVKFGPSLNGSWQVVMAAGTYTAGGTISSVNATGYISVVCPDSTPLLRAAVIDLTATPSGAGLSFAQNMRVNCQGIKVKGVRNGSGLESGFLIDAGTTGWFDNCETEDIGYNGINANLRCRLLVSGGRFKADRNGIRVYGNSTAFIGYNATRLEASATVGVQVSGESYCHTDFVDYVNCTYGLIAETNSHSTNYDCTFTNVGIGWEARDSTINIARVTFNTPPGIVRGRSLFGLMGDDDSLSTPTRNSRNIAYFPYSGAAGRWGFGYTNLTVPNRCYEFSVNGEVSGADMSLASSVGMAVDAGETNYLGLFAPSSNFAGVMFGDEVIANRFLIRHQASSLYFNIENVLKYRFMPTTFGPAVDNAIDLGSGGFRIKQIYAASAVINTSDAREKQQVRGLSDAERAVAVRLKGLIKAFKFNDAVSVKGEAARIHVGVIAQDVIDAFAAEGLDANQYALLCYDEWSETPEERDEEGNVMQEYRSAGNRYGVRYEELLAFILGAI